MSKVVVFVRGGVVQEVVADCEKVEVMIVDYDDEKCEGRPDRVFHRAYVDRELVERAATGLE